MARKFAGSPDFASIPIDLSSFSLISVAFWMWWDTFAVENDNFAIEYTPTSSSNKGFFLDMNGSTGTHNALVGMGLGSGPVWRDGFTRPSAAAWHPYLFVFDRSTPANTVYVDGAAQSLTNETHSAGSYGNFANSTLYLMSRNGASLFGLGRMAEVAIWGGVALSPGEAARLARYRSPQEVRPDRLIFHMPIEGLTRERIFRGQWAQRTEILAVTGTTSVAHPLGQLLRPQKLWLPARMIGAGRPAITPATINATSTFGGTFSKLGTQAIVPATINAASTVSGSVVGKRSLVAAQVSATSTVSGRVNALRAIRQVSITVTNPLTGVDVDSDGRYNAFPWPVRKNNGDIVAVYRSGTNHLDAGGLIAVKTGTSGGAAWGVKSYIATPSPPTSYDWRDPSVAATRTHRWLVNFFDYHVAVPEVMPPLWTMYSDNEGGVWSTPTPTTLFSKYTATTAAALQHSSGALVMPVYGQDTGDTTDRFGVAISYDDSVTWPTLVKVTAANSSYTEASLIELPDHSIVAFIRNDVFGDVSLSRSTDVGLTWSTLVAQGWTGIGGRPAAVTIPSSNVVVCWYRAAGNHAAYRISLDGTHTWGAEQTYDTKTYEYAGGVVLGDNLAGFLVSVDAGQAGVANITWITFQVNVPAGQIAATSTVSGRVSALKAVKPATVNATSTVSGSVAAKKTLTVAQISATSVVGGAIGPRRAILPTQISATSTMSGALTRLRPILPATVSAASTVSGTFTVSRGGFVALINATSTISGSVARHDAPVSHPYGRGSLPGRILASEPGAVL